MHIAEILIIAVGVSMDAFAVSICKGLSVRNLQPKHAALTALWFGGFQALMPLIGYFLGVSFTDFVSSVDHWIAFILLGIIGGNMIKESFYDDECEYSPDFSFKAMFPLAVATSIDALAIGISFAFIGMKGWSSIICPITIIGIVSFLFTIIGCLLGTYCGKRINLRAELWAGIILIGIGLKILWEHLS